VATFSGVMSACMSYGLAAGDPIRRITLSHGTQAAVARLRCWCWCCWALYDEFDLVRDSEYPERQWTRIFLRPPTGWNYFFSALAGTVWYFQFFFYTMGETQMGSYKFSSWTLHMASIIIFSSLWGIALNEWKGAGPRARHLLAYSLAVLIASTVIVGYGNYLGIANTVQAALRR